MRARSAGEMRRTSRSASRSASSTERWISAGSIEALASASACSTIGPTSGMSPISAGAAGGAGGRGACGRGRGLRRIGRLGDGRRLGRGRRRRRGRRPRGRDQLHRGDRRGDGDAQHRGDRGQGRAGRPLAQPPIEDRPDPAGKRAARRGDAVGRDHAAVDLRPGEQGAGIAGRLDAGGGLAIGGLLGLLDDLALEQPDQGIEPEQGGGEAGQHQHRPVAPGDMGDLVGEDRRGLFGLGQRVGIDQDHRPAPAPAQGRGHRVRDQQPQPFAAGRGPAGALERRAAIPGRRFRGRRGSSGRAGSGRQAAGSRPSASPPR